MKSQDMGVPVSVQLNVEEEELIQSACKLLECFKSNSLIRIYKIKNGNEIKFWKDMFNLAKENLANNPLNYLLKLNDNDDKRTKVSSMVENLIDEAFNQEVRQLLIQKQRFLEKEKAIHKIDYDLSRKYKYQINRSNRTIKFYEKTRKKNNILSGIHVILYFYRLG
jgi:hypothetical protein